MVNLSIKNSPQALLALAFFILFHLSLQSIVPWSLLPGILQQFLPPMSEFILVLVFSKIFGLKFQLSLKHFKSNPIFKTFFGLSILLAFVSIGYINLAQLHSPFRYIPKVWIHLLIIAPILEELLFRHTLITLLQKGKFSPNTLAIVSAALFSLSHLIILHKIDKVFVGFIIFQGFYTFCLGWICAMSFIKDKSLISPYVIHLFFNMIFYIGILQGWV